MNIKLDERSRYLRNLAIDALEGAQRGHVGSTMSLIEILRVLFDDIMTFDSGNPEWAIRDRLVLSKGHGCIALYALLADKGYFPTDILKTFCDYNSILGGHPEHGLIPGIETSTGSLGHGLAIGVGMAYAASIVESNHRVFVVLGDGELNEGSVWESAMAAGHHKLSNLVVIVDYNHLQSYGRVDEICGLEPLRLKWESFGFNSVEVDGHDLEQLRNALDVSSNFEKPIAVIAHTIKGRGVSFAEGVSSWHHKSSLSNKDIEMMREAVNNA